MSTSTSQSAPNTCEEKANQIVAILEVHILEVHKRIASIQIETMEAVVSGQVDVEVPLQQRLRAARELRDSLMEGLRQHIVEHRC